MVGCAFRTEEAEEDEVVDRALELEAVSHARPVRLAQLALEVLAHHGEPHHLELGAGAIAAEAAASVALAPLHLPYEEGGVTSIHRRLGRPCAAAPREGL